ncbi:hypothetical protein ET495_14145 [Xylanimonas allomyrinae]|uniref:Uncharacterized protein n=1 Tax=Xylanimonas allomyrinae TaxID=2509459 RepID=A0A4P6EMR6_9MICO|nr:hypothetical protein [Xylanimonas allomyrinae]QAY64170.1 hypothetical protein ET495_14145 [Xylanimonas allomyrinae]
MLRTVLVRVIAPVLLALGAAVLYRTGIAFSLPAVGAGMAVARRLSVWIADHASRERPVTVLTATFWHELAARQPGNSARSAPPQAF